MKPIPLLVLAAAFVGPAAAYGNGSAARALVAEYGIMTESVSRVETDVYQTYYRNDLILTSGCWVNAYGEAAVITRNQIIFIDANEVCMIVGTKPREN